MSVYILYGDNFLTDKALKDIQTQLGHPELLQANTHVISGESLDVSSMQTFCMALPFMTEYRTIVVKGYLGKFDNNRIPRKNHRKKSTSKHTEWNNLKICIRDMPPSTILIFIDGMLKQNNPMLSQLRQYSTVQHYPPLYGGKLSEWIQERAKTKGTSIDVEACKMLIQHIGGDLRSLDTELEKLALYALNRTINENDVKLLVPEITEANIFVTVDAILEGNASKSLQLLNKLWLGGLNISYVQSMIARQLRLIALSKDMIERGATLSGIQQTLGIKAEFVIRKTVDQARKSSWSKLEFLYMALLNMDLSIKKGLIEDNIALELLVAQSSITK
jgi:DNA polymerase-3 subunit delta|tara:strand:+ start:909 stop:1907 length:999 start_codon:yes stop_codon:yes gene_type:complete